MTLPIRYSPSGAVLATLGAGARLRLTEANSVMGGSLAVPAVADVVSANGFGDPTAIVLTFTNPKEANLYRAELSLDVQNTATNVEGEVVLYLDTSVDGGTTWTNRVKCSHLIDALNEAGATTGESRQVQINLCNIQGSSLGVDDGPTDPTASLKIRARMNKTQGTNGAILVNSPATSGGGSPVTGLEGTIHFCLEESLGS